MLHFLLRKISILLIIFAYHYQAASEDKQPKRPVNGQSLGSSLDIMMQKNQLRAAEKLIKSALKDQKFSEIKHFRLAQIAGKRKKSSQWRSFLSKNGKSLFNKNTKLMTEIYHQASKSDKNWLSNQLAAWGYFSNVKESACPFFELDQRKKRGDFLQEILSNNKLDKKNLELIWRNIYLLIPESVNEEKYNSSPDFLSWQKSLKLEDFIQRINNLLIFGKNLEARQTFQDALKILPELNEAQRCELDYSNAKIERKLRRYSSARMQFQALSARCSGEIVMKAEYMDLMLASLAQDLSSADRFDHFVRKYPTHDFSDDVLLFKANMYLETGDYVQALASLTQLEKLFPEGDMIERALFVKAFLQARLGNTEAAFLSLKNLKNKSKPDELAYAQAQYWIARLMLFPDLASLSNANKKNIKSASFMLQALVNWEHPNVYSWLAHELLAEIGLKPLFVKAKKIPERRKPVSSEQNLKFISLLIEQGFKHEALALLDELNIDRGQDVHMAAMADAYIRLGRPELGHQKLIKCDEAQTQNFKTRWPELYREIAWPRPFLREVNQVVSRVDVPPAVIFSMMRQESGFLVEALSWAQARGLMQLIDSTAGEQAKLLGIKSFKSEDLFKPELNLLLGSNTLLRYWQRFGHLAVALAAYNAGPVAAKRWFNENLSKPLDTYIESISYKETNAYVKNVLGGAYRYGLIGDHKLPKLDTKLSARLP